MTDILLFYDLVNLFEKIEQEQSRVAMTILLADFLKKATAEEARFIAYLSLGSLRAPYEEGQFFFAEKNIVSLLARSYQKSEGEFVALKNSCGDIGSAAALVAQEEKSSRVSVDYTILALKEKLIALQKITGIGSVTKKEHFLLEILENVSPLEQKYLLRIILGTLRLGFSEMTLLDAFSWMVTGDKSLRKELESGFTVCADIGLIVYTLKNEGVNAVKQLSIKPGIPVRPAAAERLSSGDAIFEKIGACVAQPKLDGFRVQVHIMHEEHHVAVHFFSRNLHDCSAIFPDLLPALKKIPVKSFIAEGEAICYDEEEGRFLPFQETAKRKRKHNIDQAARDYPLRLYLFDLLYYNGQTLLERSHEERRGLLASLCSQENKRGEHEKTNLFCIEEKQIASARELDDYFSQAIEGGLEGLVIKRPDAPYTPGKRNFNWIKLKRQETGSLDDTVDCVILGYYKGMGKRASFGIGALLVGVYNNADDSFYTIAKIGTGLRDEQWIGLREQLEAIKVLDQPVTVICKKELVPDQWVTPKIVCMIRADEITRSPAHSAQYALRFPRIMGQRSDKDAIDSTTIDEIKRLFSLQKTHKTD